MTSSARHCIYLSQQGRHFSPNNPCAVLNWDWRIWQGWISSILIKQALCLCFSSYILNSDSQPVVSIVGELIYKKDTTVLSCTKWERGLAPGWEVIICPEDVQLPVLPLTQLPLPRYRSNNFHNLPQFIISLYSIQSLAPAWRPLYECFQIVPLQKQQASPPSSKILLFSPHFIWHVSFKYIQLVFITHIIVFSKITAQSSCNRPNNGAWTVPPNCTDK